MKATRHDLIRWIKQKAISASDAEPSAKALAIYPAPNQWRHFLDRTLIMLSGLAIGFGLIFFIAYNWLEFGHFAKFALVEASIIAATFGYVFSQRSARFLIIGQACLVFASLALGALLALYGQTYQTGADPWNLFFNWALLMLPWLLLSRLSWLWLIWCGLLNISALLHPVFEYNKTLNLFWLVLALNLIFLSAWEFLAKLERFNHWLDNRWPIRVLAAVCCYAMTHLAIAPIFGDHSLLISVVILALIIGMGCFYRFHKADLFILALLALSVSVIVLSVLANLFFSNTTDWFAGFFFMSFATIGVGVSVTIWLKSTHKIFLAEQQENTHEEVSS